MEPLNPEEIISVDLAQRLKEAGLGWRPRLHDFFMIPNTHFEERSFVITDVQANLELYRGTPMVTFHGALEWALDHITQQEVVWLPTEAQLRAQLARHVSHLRLECAPAGCACTIALAEQEHTFPAENGADAYAEALLFMLLHESMVAGEN